MTSKTSSVKKHPAISLFRKTLRKQTPISVLVTAVGLLIAVGGPIRELLWMTAFLGAEDTLDIKWNFPTSAIGSLSVATALSFILLLFNFNFLFSKKAGDVFQALPLTRDQLFFSRALPAYIGGLFVLVVGFLSFGVVNFLPRVESLELAFITKSFLLAMLYHFCLWGCMAFAVTCCGGVFDSILALAAFNAAPVAIAWILIASAESTAVGISVKNEWVVYTSPFFFTFFKFAYFVEPLYGNKPEPIETTTLWTVLGVIAFSLVILGATVKLFRVRKSEMAGSAYAFKFVPFAISLLVSMVGGYLIGMLFTGDMDMLNVAFWIFFIIGAAICSVAFGMIASRGFKTIKRSLVNGAIAIALLIAVTLTTNLIVLNEEKQIPEAEKVKSVALGYDGDAVYTDPEDIKLIIELHKGIVSELHSEKPWGDYPNFFYNLGDLNLTYTLENGHTVKRDYNFSHLRDKREHYKILQLMQNEAFFAKYDYLTASPELKFEIYNNDLGEELLVGDLSADETAVLLTLFENEMMAASTTVFADTYYALNLYDKDNSVWEEIRIPDSFTETVEFIMGHVQERDEVALGKIEE